MPYSAVLNMITSICLLTSKDERPRSNPARSGITPRYPLDPIHRVLLPGVSSVAMHHARRLLLRLAALTEWITAYRQGLRLLPLPAGTPRSPLSKDSKPPIRIPASRILFHLRITTYRKYTILESLDAPSKPCLRQLPSHRLPPELPQIRSAQLLRRLID